MRQLSVPPLTISFLAARTLQKTEVIQIGGTAEMFGECCSVLFLSPPDAGQLSAELSVSGSIVVVLLLLFELLAFLRVGLFLILRELATFTPQFHLMRVALPADLARKFAASRSTSQSLWGEVRSTQLSHVGRWDVPRSTAFLGAVLVR